MTMRLQHIFRTTTQRHTSADTPTAWAITNYISQAPNALLAVLRLRPNGKPGARL